MKIIGLLGGMSWQSTATYYRLINEEVKSRLGGLHSAKIFMYSVDFEEIEILQHEDRWDEAAELLIDGAMRVERGGADFLVICTNTMHRLAKDVQSSLKIPLLHIADATAERIKEENINRIGLLGTRFTMEQDFYCGRLSSRHGLSVLTPNQSDRNFVHSVIYDELCLGKIIDNSRQRFLEIIKELISRGAEGIVLGCTEISLLVSPTDCSVPTFDTTEIHARRAVDWALR